MRDYTPSDFQALLALDQVCFQPGIAYSAEELSYYINLPTARTTIAESRGELVGFIVVHAIPRRGGKGKTGHIITIDIAENSRRVGAGTLLMNAGEENLANLGCDQVVLEVAVDNTAAVNFYIKHGYRIFRELPKYYMDKIDGYLMGKLLQPNLGTAAKRP